LVGIAVSVVVVVSIIAVTIVSPIVAVTIVSPIVAVTVVSPIVTVAVVSVVVSTIVTVAAIAAIIVVVPTATSAIVSVVVVCVLVGAFSGEVSFFIAFETGPGSTLRSIPAISSSRGVAASIVAAASGLGEVAFDPLAADVRAIALRNRLVGMIHLIVVDESEGKGILGADADVTDVAEGLEDFPELVLLDVDVEAGHVHFGLLLV